MRGLLHAIGVHHWGKWSEPYWANYQYTHQYSLSADGMIGPRIEKKYIQTKKCKICNIQSYARDVK